MPRLYIDGVGYEENAIQQMVTGLSERVAELEIEAEGQCNEHAAVIRIAVLDVNECDAEIARLRAERARVQRVLTGSFRAWGEEGAYCDNCCDRWKHEDPGITCPVGIVLGILRASDTTNSNGEAE